MDCKCSIRMGLIAAVFILGIASPLNVKGAEVALSKPAVTGRMSLEEALASRRSTREFTSEPVNAKDIAQLFWAAQGVIGSRGKRTAPSAGALYPLSLFLVAGNVKGLSSGVYLYKPGKHEIVKIKGGDLRRKLAAAAGGQRCVVAAPVSFVVAVNYHRMDLYDRNGKRFADMEVGHAAQNLLLEAVALGLGAVPVGIADETKAGKVIDAPGEFSATYIIPVGHPK